MLSLRNVKKDYVTGDTVVNALKGVSLDFRDNEFVSVLGQSGCGKTTLLNIVGGLDRYTEGDLIINGVSTKTYTDGDWDAYRNHTIGFVFQTYNLIMHQTVLGNVELALTLSGVSPRERKERAIAALERVGLSDQINKKPNQLSGGQMQRVAIARAIVNDPDIILADEPTGALDTQTSIQIMDILKEISNDKLIIMVTHNPELAQTYSTRIVRLHDGEVVSDTNPLTQEELAAQTDKKQTEIEGEKEQKPRKSRKNRIKKPTMSLRTALTLSLRNLLTKKARTMLVSFAGSIGIIGIALILSLSDGFQMYINKVQEDTLSGYPLTIESETVDMSAMVSAMMGIVSEEEKEKDPETIYSNNMMSQMLASMMQQQVKNNLKDFKSTLEASDIKQKTTAIKYTYDFTPQIFFMKDQPLNKTGQNYQVNPSMIGEMMGMSDFAGIGMALWTEMLDNPKLLESQYDLIGTGSRWPTEPNEVVVVVDKNEEINDYLLYSLGLIDPAEMQKMMNNIMLGKPFEQKDHKYTYSEILDIEYRLMLQSDFYKPQGNGFVRKTDEEIMQSLEGTYVPVDATDTPTVIDIEVVGIIKPKEGATATSVSGTIGYLSSLTEMIIDLTAKELIVSRQFNFKDKDVFSGLPFKNDDSAEYTMSMVNTYLKSVLGVSDIQAAIMSQSLVAYYESVEGKTPADAEKAVINLFKGSLGVAENASYETNMKRLGYVEKDNPKTISIYAVDFESKDEIIAWIDDYNASAKAADKKENIISYTDYVGIMMSSVSTIINAISYVLIGFVSISLVVSSIMIGVITYISVLERTKEIGVLRSIGASKRDISRVFNAETLIIGFAAGVFGVGIAFLIDIPINLILQSLAGLYGIAAIPWWGAIALVIISVCLTLIAGIIPSRMAAKRDPVVALRTE